MQLLLAPALCFCCVFRPDPGRFRWTMDHSYRSNMRSLSVDYTHGGRPNGFDAASTDVRTWLQQWPRVLSQLDTLVVGLKRRYCCSCCGVMGEKGRSFQVSHVLVAAPPPWQHSRVYRIKASISNPQPLLHPHPPSRHCRQDTVVARTNICEIIYYCGKGRSLVFPLAGSTVVPLQFRYPSPPSPPRS